MHVIFELHLALLVLFAPLLVLHLLSRQFVKELRVFNLWLLPASFGVVVHECSHAIAVVLCGHKLNRVKLFSPQPNGDLGYVEHSHSYGVFGYFTTMVIGLAPIMGGASAIVLLTWLFQPNFESFVRNMDSPVSMAPASIIEMMIDMVGLIEWGITGAIWLFACLSILMFMPPSLADYRTAGVGLTILWAVIISISLISPATALILTEHIKSFIAWFTPSILSALALMCFTVTLIKLIKLPIKHR